MSCLNELALPLRRTLARLHLGELVRARRRAVVAVSSLVG
jgi:hypothetical protein